MYDLYQAEQKYILENLTIYGKKAVLGAKMLVR